MPWLLTLNTVPCEEPEQKQTLWKLSSPCRSQHKFLAKAASVGKHTQTHSPGWATKTPASPAHQLLLFSRMDAHCIGLSCMAFMGKRPVATKSCFCSCEVLGEMFKGSALLLSCTSIAWLPKPLDATSRTVLIVTQHLFRNYAAFELISWKWSFSLWFQ